MVKTWIDGVKKTDADRERELEKRRLVYIRSDMYPNGEFVPELDARLSIFDRGFTIGDSAYEYARTYRHSPFQVEEHMDRMYTSLKTLRIDPGVTRKEFCGLCTELTKQNITLLEEYEEYNIVWEVTRGDWGWHGRRTPAPEGSGNPTVIIKNNLNDQRICAKAFWVGVHVVTPPGRHVNPQAWDPKIKTYSRLSFVLADLEARLMDRDAIALMLDEHGNLTETIGGNIWIVRDSVLTTPTDRNILRGQTRRNVTSIAKSLNIPVVEQDLQSWHLYNCDESFLSSTYPGPLQPVDRFNGIPIGHDLPGSITKTLAEAWSKWVGIDITGRHRLSKEELVTLEKERTGLNEERNRMIHVPY